MGQILFNVATESGEETFSGTFLLHASGSSTANGVLLDESSVVVPGSQRTFSDNGISYVYRSAMLPDGRVVIPCYEDASGYEVVVKCYAPGQLINESWSTIIVGSELAYSGGDVVILNNGNIVVTWIDYDSEFPNFVILDSDGGVVKGITDGSGAGKTADDADESFVTALDDGGFMLSYTDDGVPYTWASLWEADGTIRQSEVRIDYNEEPANVPIQMPTAGGSYYGGQVIFWDAYNGSAFWYNTTDLGEEYPYELFYYGGDFFLHAKLPQWTDRIAMVYEYSGTIRGSVVTAADVDIVEDYIIMSSMTSLNGFMALANNTFLLQATSSSDEGANFWILDANLNIVSGPTTAFTAVTGPASPSDPWSIKGASV